MTASVISGLRLPFPYRAAAAAIRKKKVLVALGRHRRPISIKTRMGHFIK
jgi:hypothetical protein